jgi:hypothetical protein
MTTSVVGMMLDSGRQTPGRWRSGKISSIAVIHDVYFQQALFFASDDIGGLLPEILAPWVRVSASAAPVFARPDGLLS